MLTWLLPLTPLLAVLVLVLSLQGVLEARDLADWILEDGLEVRLTLQLHALLWPGRQGV